MVRDIAHVQARLWVDAELRKIDLANGALVACRIAEAERALRMIRDCSHDFPRAVWMHEEILRRLQESRTADLLPA